MRPPRCAQPIAVDPEDWTEAVARLSDAQLVVGGPGTGKTEFLVRRVIHLLTDRQVSPDAITVLGFSRRGVAEIRSRIRAAAPFSIGALDVATFHSFAARVLEAHATSAGWDGNPQILTGPEQIALVHELLADENPATWSPAFAQLLGTQTFAREVTDFILRAAEQLQTPESLAGIGRAEWKGLPRFLAKYNSTLRSRGRIDYGTLIATAAEILEGLPASDQQRHVLVDEYQDTTAAQVRLLQTLRRRNSMILAAADPYQSIYSFRGATVENVAAFDTDFGNAVEPAARLLLTTSFRTPAAILEAAVAVTAGDLPSATGAVVPAPGRGAVEAYLFDQQVEETEWIASETQRIHLTQRVPYGRIGIFVRSKRRLLSDLSRALERRHIPHDLPGTRLTDQPAVRFLLDLVAAATEGDRPATQALRRVLLGSRVGLTIGTFRSLQRHTRLSGSWASSIREVLPEWDPLADLLEDASWANRLPASAGMWHVWSELPGIEAMVADPEAGEDRAAWRSLAQVLARWEERNPTGTLLEYRKLAESEDFEAQPLLSYRRSGGDRLTLTTLHQAKGLDLDVVFVADAVDGVFPDLRTRDSLLGVRHLLPYVPTETSDYRTFRLQEESRLAYTAMTRARQRVVWTATERGLDDGPGRPSRFFTRIAATVGLDTTRPAADIAICSKPQFAHDARPPVTPREAEAALRRCLADPGAAATNRLGALALLAEGPRWGLRPPALFYGVAPRGDDDGLVGDRPTLSPTQAQAYELCPRRFVLERRLKVGSDRSLHAIFGTLVHDVLQTVEKRAIDSGESHSNVEEALEEFAARFEPAEFGGEPYARSWAERGRRGIGKLYENWPASSRQGVLVEYRLTTDIAGTTWVGRADRIEKGSEGTTVVDYKTSATAITLPEAAESLQLGFYVFAAQRDETVTGLGKVAGAELWYPMTSAKTVSTREFDMAGLPDVEERLSAIAAGIRNEEWSPRPGPHCDRCGLRALCPAWAEGGPEFT